MHGFEEISPITFTVGWGPGVFSGALPVWITQREDVRSICVRRVVSVPSMSSPVRRYWRPCFTWLAMAMLLGRN